MFDWTSLLNFVPKPIAVFVVSVVFGGLAFAGLETRYMTVSDFTKSYVLDLKREIRELRKDLRNAESDREREQIRDAIDALLDELCYEKPNDLLCKAQNTST